MTVGICTLFFKHCCQPTVYISEGESKIVTQSNESATVQVITTREILPKFTMIGHNRHQNGHIVLKQSLSQD